ncbi:hypothetical protein BHE74_00059852 [Ensete ventricosum]|nr:hypothetical protein BHE74_00059852 [Ensete ventricosum]
MTRLPTRVVECRQGSCRVTTCSQASCRSNCLQIDARSYKRRLQAQCQPIEAVTQGAVAAACEDEGGQASSSLAVSTRWISTAKLLQFDLATLAQREGGE